METHRPSIYLLDRFMRGETCAEEEQHLLAWFRNPASREEILAFYRQKWQEAEGKELPAEVQSRMFNAIARRIREAEESRQPATRLIHPTLFRQLAGRWSTYAALALLCVGIGWAVYTYTHPAGATETPRLYTVYAEKGQRAGITLPDGTKVWLNSHTRLSYPLDYGQKVRTVRLAGEAYFEVAKDKKHPFVVKAGEMEVEALGTAFNVKAYDEDNHIIATLFEGSIRTEANHKTTLLQPNQSVCFDRNRRQIEVHSPENPSYARMWRDNELAFNGETLRDIAVLLNRLYNIEVKFESDKIKNYRFSGVIKNNSLDNVFEIISLTAPILYETRGDTILLREKRTRTTAGSI